MNLQCRKCGSSWGVRDKALKDKKRCPDCETLQNQLGKRAYEALDLGGVSGAKPPVDGLVHRERTWEPHDALYKAVVKGIQEGVKVRVLMSDLGLSYKVFKDIAVHALGEGYQEEMYRRKSEAGHQNLERMNGKSDLEKGFASQIQDLGFTNVQMNVWQHVRVSGRRVPREADIKVPLGDGRKIVVLCDGIAFHGPACIFNAQKKIVDDVETARAYHAAGYSVLRYSEPEIQTGVALGHFQVVTQRLQSCQSVYRTWHPPVEEYH